MAALVSSAVALSVAIALASCIRNRYFHTLKDIPGPLWAGVTRVWYLYHAAGGRIHEMHVACHEEYGPIVRVAPNFVIVNDPEYAKRFYTWDRSEWGRAFEAKKGIRAIVSMGDMKQHAVLRKKVAGGFSLSSIAPNEGVIDGHISTWIQQLHTHSQATLADPMRAPPYLNLSKWIQFLTIDVVMDIAFFAPLGFLKQGIDIGGLLNSISTTFKVGNIFMLVPELVTVLQLPFIWPFVIPKPTDISGVGYVIGVGNEAVRKRLAGETTSRDIVQHWIEYRDKDGERMTTEELMREAAGPTGAGADTTASAIHAVILYIASNPKVYFKLRAEIDATSENGEISEPVKYQEALKLPYLQAVIAETLRVHPPIGTPFARVIPKGGAEMCGHHLPAGTWVFMPQWSLSRNRSLYGDDADVFEPERWLAKEGSLQELRINDWKRLDTTWGMGGVKCLGMHVAAMEINKAVVELFRKFDIQIINPERPWKSSNRMTFVQKDFWVKLRTREEVELMNADY